MRLQKPEIQGPDLFSAAASARMRRGSAFSSLSEAVLPALLTGSIYSPGSLWNPRLPHWSSAAKGRPAHWRHWQAFYDFCSARTLAGAFLGKISPGESHTGLAILHQMAEYATQKDGESGRSDLRQLRLQHGRRDQKGTVRVLPLHKWQNLLIPGGLLKLNHSGRVAVSRRARARGV
jgi:hypothetical protein